MKCETFTTDAMLQFYENFDPVTFKYSLLGKIQNEDIDHEQLIALERYEDARQFSSLTRKDYGDIRANLDLVYAEKSKTNNMIEIFDLIFFKIIGRYLGIDGMERLFSEKYIDFEWDMHLGIDYKKHSMKFYRDHFIHQIRDAYMLHILLREFGYEERVYDILCDFDKSKISRFVCKHVEQQKYTGYTEMLRSFDADEHQIKEFYFKNIIYMSSYMAALFHDIGYPETFNTVNQNRITEYMATLYNVGSVSHNFSRITALLQNSLLFRIVSLAEIRARVNGEEMDHGAMSAIMFLMHFYENGAIYQLEPYKKCAVELAGLAIYNHTNKYSIQDPGRETAYHRPVLEYNPISYLLRICDDLQEWERVYFEVSQAANMILCRECKTPIVRKVKELKNGRMKKFYVCNCNARNEETGEVGEEGVFKPIFDGFSYRRLYNVSVCDKVTAYLTDDGGKIIYNLNYELRKLLHIVFINHMFAKYRSKELNQVKKILNYQDDPRTSYLEYFVSANPILIKVVILGERIGDIKDRVETAFHSLIETAAANEFSVKDAVEKAPQYMLWQTEAKKRFESEFAEDRDKIVRVAVEPLNNDILKKHVQTAIELYFTLYVVMIAFKSENQNMSGKANLKSLQKIIAYELSCSYKNYPDLQELIADCLLQFTRMYHRVWELDTIPAEYYEQYKCSDYTYSCIERYVSAPNYVPIMQNKEEAGKMIDAFSDLSFFEEQLS